jgi:hypothetical protein
MKKTRSKKSRDTVPLKGPMHEITVALFYTADLLTIVLHVMVPQLFRFLLCFLKHLW